MGLNLLVVNSNKEEINHFSLASLSLTTVRPAVAKQATMMVCSASIDHFSSKKNTSIFPYLQKKYAMSLLQNFSKCSIQDDLGLM